MRPLRAEELTFIQHMLKGSDWANMDAHQLASLRVEDMDDAGMGSILFVSSKPDRVLGKDIASCQFQDLDGVAVLATLSLDQHGDLYELDIWKTDFSRLIRLPSRFNT